MEGPRTPVFSQPSELDHPQTSRRYWFPVSGSSARLAAAKDASTHSCLSHLSRQFKSNLNSLPTRYCCSDVNKKSKSRGYAHVSTATTHIIAMMSSARRMLSKAFLEHLSKHLRADISWRTNQSTLVSYSVSKSSSPMAPS